MSRTRLKLVLVAGCLMLEAAGCRTSVTAPFGHIRARTPWGRSDNCLIAPPQAPVASSDQNRPAESATSPSIASPESAEQYSEPAPPAEVDPAAVPELQAEQAAAETLKKFGGRVTSDSHGHVTAVDLAQTPITDLDLKVLSACPGIVELNLRGTLVSDAGLETVGSFSRLEFLGLTGTMITDAGLERLPQLEQLRFLTLAHTAVTDAGLATLARCSKLEGLNLKATAVTAAGLVQFQSQVASCRIVSDVTSTTSIESQDLPLPMMDDSGATNETAAPTDVAAPLPPSEAPGVLPDNVANPFEPAPETAEPVQDDEEAAPPAPQQSDRIINPDAAARAMRLPQRATAGNGPSKRLEVVLTERLSDPEVLRAIARSYAERGEWDAAAAVLRAAVERSPLNHDLQFELGIAEARSGDYVASLMHLQQCGDLAVAHYNLGVLLHEAGLLDASILAFRSALRYDPDLNQARVWLSDLAPKQAAAAAGGRPSMIGAPSLTPVEPPVDEPSDGSGIEIRPASGRRIVKRSPLAATELGSKQPAARE